MSRPTHRLMVTSRHPDGTPCGHKLTPSGRAKEDGCRGREDYVATCVCGWEQTGRVRAALEYAHATHKNSVTRGARR